MPSHHLTITFDLENHVAKGVSRIDIPADTGVTLFLADLFIQSIVHTGGALLPTHPGPTLELQPESSPQNITLVFEKRFPPQEGNLQSIVSEQGITLTGSWHPMINTDAPQEFTAIIPSHFKAVSEIAIITERESAEGKEVLLKLPPGTNTATFVAGPYVVEKDSFGEGKELYTYFFPEDQALAATYRKKTLSYLERYEELIGPYPFGRFSIVENRLPTGFAMPSMTLLGQAVVRLPFIQDTSLGHEVLHSWFGNSVDIDTSQGNWAEGLTTYLADQLYAQDKGEDADFRKEQLIKIHNFVNDANAIALVDFKNTLDKNIQDKAIRAIGYGKASMLFHMLRMSLGDETFFSAIQDFSKRMRGKTAGWKDIITSFETVSGSSMKDYFSQWLERKDLPWIEATKIQSDEKDGQPVLAFTLEQKTDSLYSMEVPLVIRTMQGDVKKTIEISEKETSVEIPLPGSPIELAIDPEYDLIRLLDHHEIPAVWSGFIGDSDKLAVIGSESAHQTFKPLLEVLETLDCPIADSGDVSISDLEDTSVIFLGVDNNLVRSIFAQVVHPEQGFTLDIRKNPLSTEHTAVLVTSSDTTETAAVAGKLKHYNKYSFLHFENGRNREKKISPADHGTVYILAEAPTGINLKDTRSFADIISQIRDTRVVYVGENHGRYEDHKLQLEVTRALHSHDPQLAIGMEMFPRDVQEALDDYIAGKTDEPAFLKAARYYKNWGYDYRMYRPIIDFARRHRIPVLGLNLEKKIPSKVFKENGIESLTDQELDIIPEDRDLDMPGYQDRIAQAFSFHSHQALQTKRFTNFLQSQALWDETMAETIADYLTDHPEKKMVVIAGQGHVYKDTAIPPRVARRLPVEQAVLLNAAGKEVDSTHVDYALFLTPASLPEPALMGIALTEEEEGLVVSKVSVHGKAQKAGLKEQDIIVSIDGKAIETMDDLKITMLYKEKGDTVILRVKRKYAIFPDTEKDIEISL